MSVGGTEEERAVDVPATRDCFGGRLSVTLPIPAAEPTCPARGTVVPDPRLPPRPGNPVPPLRQIKRTVETGLGNGDGLKDLPGPRRH